MKKTLFSLPEHALLHALTTLCIGVGSAYPLSLALGLVAPLSLLLGCGALVTLLAICGLTHHDSYFDIAVIMGLKFFVPFLCILFYMVTGLA